jgi:hypothetical protein
LLTVDERVNVAAGALVECAKEQHNRVDEVEMPPTIRLATAHDASGVQAIYTPIVRGTTISFELEPPSVEDMGRRIEATLQHMPRVLKELTVFAIVYNLVRMVMRQSATLQPPPWSGSASSMPCGGSARQVLACP